MSLNVSPRVIAGDINAKLRQLGGDEIAGLERLDPVKLQKLQKGLGEFLDKYASGPQTGANDLQQLVGANAVESMREFARLISADGSSAANAPQNGARRVGFCGGPPAPPPQAPPPPVSPERAIPLQARPVSPEQAATAGGDVVLGALSNGSSGPVRLGGVSNGASNTTAGAANASTAANAAAPTVQQLVALNLAANFNPLASNFVPSGAISSSQRSSPTQGFNPLAALNFAQGLGNNGALNSVSGSFGALAASSVSGVDPNLESLQGAGGGGGMFEDRVFGLMLKIVADMQKQVEDRLKKLQEQAEAAEKKGKKKGKGGFLGGVVKSVVGIAAPIVGTVIGGPVGGMIGNAVGKAVTGGGGGGGGGSGGGAGGAGGGQESRNIEFEKIKFDMQKLSQMQQALSNVLNTMDELAKSAIRNIKGG